MSNFIQTSLVIQVKRFRVLTVIAHKSKRDKLSGECISMQIRKCAVRGNSLYNRAESTKWRAVSRLKYRLAGEVAGGH